MLYLVTEYAKNGEIFGKQESILTLNIDFCSFLLQLSLVFQEKSKPQDHLCCSVCSLRKSYN